MSIHACKLHFMRVLWGVITFPDVLLSLGTDFGLLKGKLSLFFQWVSVNNKPSPQPHLKQTPKCHLWKDL